MSQKVKLEKIKIILFFLAFIRIIYCMKIKILLFLYLTMASVLFSNERMTYTFKTHNFRIELPTHWELTKSLADHKHKPILVASSEEDRIHLEIYVFPREAHDLKQGFLQTLKNKLLKLKNLFTQN